MTEVHTEAGSATEAVRRAGTAAHSRIRRHLLAGVATVALLAAGSVYTLRAYSGDATQFGASSAARMPATPIAMPGFTDLVTAVKPAVVSVRVKADSTTQQIANGNDDDPLEGTPFDRYFKDFRGPRGQKAPDQKGGQRHQFVRGQGSGFFISSDGYVVTNNHVVDGAVKVEVVTDSGATFDAKVIGTDSKTDLALLKVDGRTDFPFVKLATATPQIGEWVVAMGNPFGLGGTVTAGIVSARGRDIGSGPYDDYIQIDAPVNQGNSGGPTFNLKGEVIGVNTAIFSPTGGSVGIAFDIPASTVASVIPQLQRNGQVSRGWLGVQIQPVTGDIAEGLGLQTPKGVLISEPQAHSPAAMAGLKSGDVITAVDATEIKDPRDLARKIAAFGPAKAITLGIIRDGQELTVTLKLGEHPDQKVRKASSGNRGKQTGLLGLMVAPASDANGLTIVNVDPGGKAAELGFQKGDIILKAGNRTVSSAEDLTAAFSETAAAGRKNTLVMVKRNQTQHYVAVPVAVG